MYLELVVAAITIGRYIYHRYTQDDPRPPRAIGFPTTDEGAIIPIFYGRVRINQPVIAWYGNATATLVAAGSLAGTYYHAIDILYVLGIPISEGNTKLHAGLLNDYLSSTGDKSPNINDSAFGAPGWVRIGNGATTGYTSSFTEMDLEFGDGSSAQNFNPSTARTRMLASGISSDDISSYRGYATVLGRMGTHSNSPPRISWEISTYPGSILLTATKVGLECNPADVIYDLISRSYDEAGQLGKLGLIAPVIDVGAVDSTFLVAAQTLLAEGNGYSRVIDSNRSADDIIQEILRQIDGILYEDPRTGKFKLKLIRADFDVTTIPRLSPSNCVGLQNFAAAGWTSVVNKVRVTFPDRSRDYNDGSAVAHNQANSVGLDGEVNEIVLDYPGVCTLALAQAIAGRELAARSRPLAKFQAVVDRSFYRVAPGDPILVSWPDANISGMVFRVANISRGAADSNLLYLDLIQDFGYVHRNAVIGIEESVGAFPGAAAIYVP